MTNVAIQSQDSKKPLKMVTCLGCGVKAFISSDLAPLETVACSRCGYPLMIPLRMGQFELRAPIASGGMGTVYRAIDLMLEREVAVKLMKKELMDDQEALDSFYREARTCAALNHTNIIHIYTFDQWEEQLYLVMELADRGSLESRIEKEERLPELDVLDVGIKVASALDSALKKNFLHRDIKPGNILFNAEGEPKVVDFGLARSTESGITEESVMWATPYYVAPEKVMREQEDFLADMYSLAGTLYHAITGHVPFEAPTVEEIINAHIYTPLTPPREVVPDITQQTSDALIQAMAKDPSYRFSTYDDLVMALTAARSHLLVERYNRPSQETPPSGGSGRGWWRR